MGSDLDKPLGQNRRQKPAGRPRRAFFASLTGGLLTFAVIAGASYTALVSDGTWEGDAPVASQTAAANAGGAESNAGRQVAASDSPADTDDALSKPDRSQTTASLQSGDSGATIETMTTGSGATVNTVSPRSRDGDGPVIIRPGVVRGQDPHMASMPAPELVAASPFGKLPVRSDRGARPMDVYARPWSGARGARIAVVVGGLGLSQTGTMKAIDTLPEEVTLAFAASGNSLQRWMQAARRSGHELLVQVPFEPFDYPRVDPGANTLTVDAGSKANLSDLHRAMGRMTNYTGVMNYMGGRFMADPDAMEPVMRDLAGRGLMFFDDGTSARSLTPALAHAAGAAYATADVQIDSDVKRGAILKKLDALERIARRKGTAIGVASAFDTSVTSIAAWANEAKSRGIEIVGISALAEDPERKE